MECLYCSRSITAEHDWGNILIPARPELLCDKCEKQFLQIIGTRCEKCSKASATAVCKDCSIWAADENDVLEKNLSIFHYNETMRDFITKWKYRGDYMLGNCFEHYIIEAYKKHFAGLNNLTVVPIPLSKGRNLTRRFNQAEQLASFLTKDYVDALEKINEAKQSKRNRQERMNSKNPFTIVKNVKENALLVDDIYTTGATLRHAASVLKNNGAKKVYALTLIHG